MPTAHIRIIHSRLGWHYFPADKYTLTDILGLSKSYVIHRLELIPMFSEVDRVWIFCQFAGLHLNKGQILQVQTTTEREGIFQHLIISTSTK